MNDRPDGNKAEDEEIRAARAAMVEAILEEVEETRRWTARKSLAPAVVEAMGKVPRHRFVPKGERHLAYENRPLPIGSGQTISQPYIVALMTDLADLKPESRVLEIGGGCGYQTAVLAELAAEVWSVELLRELAEPAAERLEALGYDNVHVRVGDGSRGWPEAAPFDAILVTAAAHDRIPPALADQLAPGGRMIIPVGEEGRFRDWGGPVQELVVVTREASGELRERKVLPVAFVPLFEGPEGGGESDAGDLKA